MVDSKSQTVPAAASRYALWAILLPMLYVGGSIVVLPDFDPPSVLDAADERVSVPMQPPVESLNTAVTAAVLIYEAFRQRTRPAAPQHLRTLFVIISKPNLLPFSF